ncbi:hypothetical protein T3H97_22660 [Paenibacillus sp. LX16]|nr:hypothetical protein [Paenibacillus sp. LX16]
MSAGYSDGKPLDTRLEHLMTARLEAGRSVRPDGSRYSFVSRRLTAPLLE